MHYIGSTNAVPKGLLTKGVLMKLLTYLMLNLVITTTAYSAAANTEAITCFRSDSLFQKDIYKAQFSVASKQVYVPGASFPIRLRAMHSAHQIPDSDNTVAAVFSLSKGCKILIQFEENQVRGVLVKHELSFELGVQYNQSTGVKERFPKIVDTMSKFQNTSKKSLACVFNSQIIEICENNLLRSRERAR